MSRFSPKIEIFNQMKLLIPFQSIENLDLQWDFSYLDLDNLVNLKQLKLAGTINDNFNFEIFKNLCNQLEELFISFTNIDDHNFFKIFDGLHFTNLHNLIISECYIQRVKLYR